MNNKEVKKQINKKIRLYKTTEIMNTFDSVGIATVFGIMAGTATQLVTDNTTAPLVVTSITTGVLSIYANKIFEYLQIPQEVTKNDLKILKSTKKELKKGTNNLKNIEVENFEKEFLKYKK